MTSPRGLDLASLGASILGALMLVGYLSLIRSEDNGGPAIWFVVGMVVAVLLAGYGASTPVRGRRIVLGVATVLFAGLGLLAILSIGLPILLAAVLSGVALARAR